MIADYKESIKPLSPQTNFFVGCVYLLLNSFSGTSTINIEGGGGVAVRPFESPCIKSTKMHLLIAVQQVHW